MDKQQASQQALDQLYQESGAPQLFNTLFWLAFIAVVFYIVYRYRKNSAAKQKIQQEILNELRKQNSNRASV